MGVLVAHVLEPLEHTLSQYFFFPFLICLELGKHLSSGCHHGFPTTEWRVESDPRIQLVETLQRKMTGNARDLKRRDRS